MLESVAPISTTITVALVTGPRRNTADGTRGCVYGTRWLVATTVSLVAARTGSTAYQDHVAAS
jgi:hypothetical protein